MAENDVTLMDRRKFVRNGTIGTLAFQIAGGTALLSPREARAKNVALQYLNERQAKLLGAFCDHLLPGARDAGVVEFVDHQLGEIPNECLLMCKYFPGINAPYTDFYHGGLSALDAYTQKTFSKGFEDLAAAEQDQTVQALWTGEVDPWQGPPPPLFYMMLRSDAVDVVYGTESGFEELGLPYLAHISPPSHGPSQWVAPSNAPSKKKCGGTK